MIDIITQHICQISLISLFKPTSLSILSSRSTSRAQVNPCAIIKLHRQRSDPRTRHHFLKILWWWNICAIHRIELVPKVKSLCYNQRSSAMSPFLENTLVKKFICYSPKLNRWDWDSQRSWRTEWKNKSCVDSRFKEADLPNKTFE